MEVPPLNPQGPVRAGSSTDAPNPQGSGTQHAAVQLPAGVDLLTGAAIKGLTAEAARARYGKYEIPNPSTLNHRKRAHDLKNGVIKRKAQRITWLHDYTVLTRASEPPPAPKASPKPKAAGPRPRQFGDDLWL
mgnify:CR=1 FL=1